MMRSDLDQFDAVTKLRKHSAAKKYLADLHTSVALEKKISEGSSKYSNGKPVPLPVTMPGRKGYSDANFVFTQVPSNLTIAVARTLTNAGGQAPASTVRGTSNHMGTTGVLDACALLRPAVFESVLAVAQNDVVERSSLEIRPVVSGKRHPENDCSRKCSASDLASAAAPTVAEQQYGRAMRWPACQSITHHRSHPPTHIGRAIRTTHRTRLPATGR